MKITVIAKAYGDEPLCRVVVGTKKGLVYLLNPSSISSQFANRFSGVGFPRESVFAYRKALFDSLSRAYKAGDSDELARLWSTAAPFRNIAK